MRDPALVQYHATMATVRQDRAGLALSPAGFSVTGGGGATSCCAAQVAELLGTIHHEFTFTVQEGLDALEDLVWHIESFEQVCGVLRPWCTRGSRPCRQLAATCYRSACTPSRPR